MPSDNNGKNKVILEIQGDSIAIFVRRLNRFLGSVRLEEQIVEAHIHDPGRLEELLFPGNLVLLKRYSSAKRKTSWEIIAARLHNTWIFLNSKFHRPISERILKDEKISPFGKVDDLIPEVKVGNSRLDFLLLKGDERIWVEVKGCTLVHRSEALFPDAPTSRGRRHVEELIKLRKGGDRAALIFLVFPRASCFSPNIATDPEFAELFSEAIDVGVEVYPLLLGYDGSQIFYQAPIPICESWR